MHADAAVRAHDSLQQGQVVRAWLAIGSAQVDTPERLGITHLASPTNTAEEAELPALRAGQIEGSSGAWGLSAACRAEPREGHVPHAKRACRLQGDDGAGRVCDWTSSLPVQGVELT